MTRRSSRLQVYPSVDLIAHARAALAGARYHLARVQELVSIWRRTPGSDKADGGILHWHLRAFFWELVAAMETSRLALLPRRSRSKTTSSRELAGLEQATHEEWWGEVQEWRNFAHRAFLFVQGEFHPDGTLNFLFLPPLVASGPQHMVPDRLEYYLGEMRQLQERVLPTEPGDTKSRASALRGRDGS
jgi:hypothetical protein